MTEKPILFSDQMVRAILDDSKTQTRRVIKPQPYKSSINNGWILHLNKPTGDPLATTFCCYDSKSMGEMLSELSFQYGHVGDRLWVRETFAENVGGCENGIPYRADHIDPRGDGPAHPMKWKPSIHMPRSASRITLEINNVRAQRLQDITEEDAREEGFESVTAFSQYWDSLNEKPDCSWDANPWVWAISFRRIV